MYYHFTVGSHWRGRVDNEERFSEEEATTTKRVLLWFVGILFQYELTRPMALLIQRLIALVNGRDSSTRSKPKEG